MPPLTAKNLPKIGKKREKNQEKEGKNQEKTGKKRTNREEKAKSGSFFHFAPPDR